MSGIKETHEEKYKNVLKQIGGSPIHISIAGTPSTYLIGIVIGLVIEWYITEAKMKPNNIFEFIN